MLEETYGITSEELAEFYAEYDRWLDEHTEDNDFLDYFESTM